MIDHVVSEVTLKNGLKGLFIDIANSNVVSAQINFRAGEYLVDLDKWETAHLLEHLVLCANSQFAKARDFQSAIERHGAYTNASTGLYDVTYELEASSDDAVRVLELLLGAISDPAFLSEEFDTEMQTVEEELVMRSNDHFRELNIALKKAMGLRVVSDKDRLKLLKNVSKKDVADHHKATHTINNARFIISGNTESLKKKLEGAFTSNFVVEAGDSRKALPEELPVQLKEPLIISKQEVPNVYMYIDLYSHRLLDFKDQQAVRIISTVLTETLYSRIFGVAREKGIIYGMGSGLMRTGSVSGMWFGAQVSQKNIIRLANLIYDELQRIKTGILDDQDLQLAKDYMLGKTARVYQTAESMTEAYSHYFTYDTYFDISDEAKTIKKLTATKVCDIFRLLLSSQIGAVGFLGAIDKETADKVYKTLSPLWLS